MEKLKTTFEDYLFVNWMPDADQVLDDDIEEFINDFIIDADPAMLVDWANKYGQLIKENKIR